MAAQGSEQRRSEPDIPGIMAGLTAWRPDPSDAAAVSAWMLPVLGVLHSPVYGARELRSRLVDEGIPSLMAAYLAHRAAPLGPVGPEVVAATFYGFSPTAIAEHFPESWDRVSPRRTLEITFEIMAELLEGLFRGREDEVRELAGLLTAAAAEHQTAGRPLAAAWSGVAATGTPLLDLWLATCVIRESRGDGHIALLVVEDIGPLESHLVTHGDAPERRRSLEVMRGWTGAEIDAAVERLQERGLLDEERKRTDAARTLRADIERRTDVLSAAPWAAVGPAAVDRIGDIALALLPPVIASGTLLPAVIERLAPRA
jgi:hypothetical protein